MVSGAVAGAVAGVVADAAGGAVAGVVAGAVAGVVGDAVVSAVDDAVFSDLYAVAAAVVFTTYRSLILVPEFEIPPGDDIVNAPRPNVERAPVRSNWRGFVAKLYEHALAQLVDAAAAAAVRTMTVLVVSVPVRSVGQWSAILVNMI